MKLLAACEEIYVLILFMMIENQKIFSVIYSVKIFGKLSKVSSTGRNFIFNLYSNFFIGHFIRKLEVVKIQAVQKIQIKSYI